MKLGRGLVVELKFTYDDNIIDIIERINWALEFTSNDDYDADAGIKRVELKVDKNDQSC